MLGLLDNCTNFLLPMRFFYVLKGLNLHEENVKNISLKFADFRVFFIDIIFELIELERWRHCLNECYNISVNQK
jgi:hypothetical protein